MIIKTEILFNDAAAEKMGTKEQFIWGRFLIDMSEVVAVGEFVKDNEVIEGTTEITFRGGGDRVIKEDFDTFASEWMAFIEGGNKSVQDNEKLD